MNNQQIAFIVILTVVLIVFGGIASILPSRRSRQIGNMRIAARKCGLTTSLVQIDDVNAELRDRVTAGGVRREPKKRCVAWAKYYSEEYPDIPAWIAYVKNGRESTETHWQLDIPDSQVVDLPDSYWREVDRVKRDLPSRCIALECTASEVRWLGYENIETNEEKFIQTMNQCLDALMKLNVSIWREQNDAEKSLESGLERP